MRRLSLLLLSIPLAVAAQTPRPASEPLTADECAVWQRELGFAKSVADHDAAVFGGHLHPQAAFGIGQPPATRGRDAIVQQWTPIIDGKRVRLLWYPDHVVIAGEPDVAVSTGPALFENLEPGPAPKFSTSRFQSVWHRAADGTWQVLYDSGTAPKPADAAAVAAFHAGRREACPER
jgi:ketosteroid isomerase-like protein